MDMTHIRLISHYLVVIWCDAMEYGLVVVMVVWHDGLSPVW